ncbi:MAG: DEAD/DEAH box helicase [Nitrososphaeria archaeon]|nr:DEAD/DEAH box helicase [Nitrososphaeria archaeon]
MNVDSLPLPEQVKILLKNLGYHTLYPPQEEAVKKGVLNGKNVLLTTPTASGKTLIALMCAAKAVLENKKVIYLTPLKALANEKYEEFKSLSILSKTDGSNPTIAISTGDYDVRDDYLKEKDVLILTNEKFDSMIRHDPSWVERIGLVIFDEIHLLNDDDRGPVIEILISHFLSHSIKPQIIALSATVSNYKDIASWIGAETVNISWRPVKLIEGVYQNGQIFFYDGQKFETLRSNYGPAIDVAYTMLKEGGQVLIFSDNRKNAVSLAEKATVVSSKFLSVLEAEKLKEFYEKIIASEELTGIGQRLANCVLKGSAFHHAGLSHSHRTLIEESFKEGYIKILCATPTLAAGVNLPARTVVINSLARYHSECGQSEDISVLEYKQLCGRAGRPKYDNVGYAITVLRSGDPKTFFEHYVKGSPEPIYSKLINTETLRNHVLATIVRFPGLTEKELYNFFSNTLLGYQRRPQFVLSKIKSCLSYLKLNDLIEEEGERYISTEFGKNISFLYISTSTGIHYKTIFEEYKNIKNKNINDEDLILLSAVSSGDFQPKFYLRHSDYSEFKSFIENNLMSIFNIFANLDFKCFEYVGRSFLSLKSWINEETENEIYEKFSIEPGDLYRQVESAHWLVHAFTKLSNLFGIRSLQSVSSSLEERLRYGVKKELLELTKLEGIGRVRARILFFNGYKTIDDLKKAKEQDLAKIPKLGPIIAKKIKEQLKYFP